MKNSPLVSYCLFTYNQERYISESVKAALAQTYSPTRIIISDDCSTDRTVEMIQDAVSKYTGPHEVYFNKNTENMGIVPHVNKILSIVESDYVVFAAGDDISYPHRVSQVVRVFQSRKCSAVYSAADKVNDVGDVVGKIQFHNYSAHRHDFTFKCPAYYGAGASYSMQIIKRYGLVPCDVRNEDANLMWKALFCDGLAYTNERLLSYRLHENNFTITRIIDQTPDGKRKCNKMIENHLNIRRNLHHALRISNLRWKPAILRNMLESIIYIAILKIKVLYYKIDS